MLNHPPANPCPEFDLLRHTPEDNSMSAACPTLAEVRAAIKNYTLDGHRALTILVLNF